MVKATEFRIVSPQLSVFPDEMLPVYLLQGEKNYLVDASVTSRAEALKSALKNALADRKLDGILLTHTHYDHLGAVPLIQDCFGCPAFLAKQGRQVLLNPRAIKLIADLNREFALQEGLIAPEFSGLGDMIGLEQDSRLDFSRPAEIVVHETPGHTRCSISFLLPESGILFPGDATGIVERSGRHKPLFLSSYKNYLDSLNRLALLPVDLLALPHNTPVRGRQAVRDYFDRAREAAERTRELILEHPGDDRNLEETAAGLLAIEFNNPALMGSKSAMMINAMAMIKAVRREFPNQH